MFNRLVDTFIKFVCIIALKDKNNKFSVTMTNHKKY